MGKYDNNKTTGKQPENNNNNRFQKMVDRSGFQLRTVLLALPIAALAIILAIWNIIALPAQVGFSMATSGEFTYTVSKIVAVICPLAITAASLLMVFLSKKILYPWLISLFSLVLPLVILLVNTFPR